MVISLFLFSFSGCSVKHLSTSLLEIDNTNQFFTVWEWSIIENGKIDNYKYIEGLGENKFIILKDVLGTPESITYNTKMTWIKRQENKILSFKVGGITFINDEYNGDVILKD